MSRARPEYRITPFGDRVRLMTEAEGWVMARRPGCMPFTVMLKMWRTWKHEMREGGGNAQ